MAWAPANKDTISEPVVVDLEQEARVADVRRRRAVDSVPGMLESAAETALFAAGRLRAAANVARLMETYQARRVDGAVAAGELAELITRLVDAVGTISAASELVAQANVSNSAAECIDRAGAPGDSSGSGDSRV